MPDRSSISQVLLSRPEELAELLSDLRALERLRGSSVVVINRPSSMVREAGLLDRYRAKGRMWQSVGGILGGLSRKGAVLVLEDARRYDEVEYKVHPAIYYLCRVILDALEEGKEVLHYRILKNRPQRA
jgi:hypothetical protein